MTNKDTYWFPHDYTPTDDPKMQAMLEDYGGLGYGIYWRIVEMFHSESTHKVPFKKYVYSAIAKQMRPNPKQNKFLLNAADISCELIETFVRECISEYELFVSDDTHFWSERANRNIDKKAGISNERSIAAKKSVEARKSKQNQAIAQQTSAIRGEETIGDYNNNQIISLNKGEKPKKNSPEWDEMMKKIREANPDVPHLNNNSK